MKSSEISVQTWDDTSRGCSRPAGHSVSVLFSWHVGAGMHPILDQCAIARNELRAEPMESFVRPYVRLRGPGVAPGNVSPCGQGCRSRGRGVVVRPPRATSQSTRSFTSVVYKRWRWCWVSVASCVAHHMSSRKVNEGPERAKAATAVPLATACVYSVLRRESTSATMFSHLGRYSTSKSKPNNLLIHWCCGMVERR